MTDFTWTVDAHCHWSDARLFAEAPKRLAELHQIRAFLLGGVEPEEWRRQDELHRLFPAKVFRAFALHPYTVEAWPAERLEAALQDLKAALPRLDAVGEIGLDFRQQFKNRDRQLEYFRKQLALAGGKPVILHVVRAHEEALRALRNKNVKGMVHAFTGGPELATRYLDLGLFISVGAKILYPETEALHETVKQIPLARLLLESDCPDQAPPGKKTHDSATVLDVARMVAEIKNLSFNQVVEHTRANLFSLLKKETP